MNWIRLTREDGSDLFVRANHIIRMTLWKTKGEVMTLLFFADWTEMLVREVPSVVMALTGAHS